MVVAIINHRCYKRKKPDYAESIVNFLKARLGASIVFTEYAGHATDIAKASSDYDIIIAVGGDGTIAEIVNGMDLEKQVLGVVPLGTGNSFARNFKIGSPRQVLDTIAHKKPTIIDLIDCSFKIKDKVFKRYAIATTGMGFIADAVAFAQRYLKATGIFCYPASTCAVLFNRQVIRADAKIDDSLVREIEFTILTLNNSIYAGNFPMFPTADFKDSMLDLVYAKTNAVTQFLYNISVLSRTYFYIPSKPQKVSKLNLCLDKPVRLMLDGEIFGPVDEVTYSVVPGGLRVLSQ